MTLLATFKHISSKNADYGAAEAYLTFEHDEFTMKPALDENGRLIPREDYRISSLNCGSEDFAVACMRANVLCSELRHLCLDDFFLIVGDEEKYLIWSRSVCHRRSVLS